MFGFMEHDLIKLPWREARVEPIGDKDARFEESDYAWALQRCCGADLNGTAAPLNVRRSNETISKIDRQRILPQLAQPEGMKDEISGAKQRGGCPERSDHEAPASIDTHPWRGRGFWRRSGNAGNRGGRKSCDECKKRETDERDKGRGPNGEAICRGGTGHETKADSQATCEDCALPDGSNGHSGGLRG